MQRCIALLTALLSACTMGPDFHPPRVAAPALWGSERTDVPSHTIATDVDPRWWDRFRDAELSSLVQRLVRQNLDLQEAAARIGASRAQRQIVAAQGLPHIDEQSSYMHERQSVNGFLELITPAPGAPLDYDIWQNGLTSSWDLDLFGRVRRGVEAANAATLASIDNRRGMALAALADLALDYLQLRGAQTQLDIAVHNLALADENEALVRDRFGNGVASTLEVAQARSQRASIAATLAPLRTQVAALINAIGLLLAEPPRALAPELTAPAAVPLVPKMVAIGVPATLVRRRPDVLEAEANLHEATARTGVAIASFYPDITLNGMANLNGLNVVDAFSLPSSAFQVGPTFSLPIFEGGRLRGQLRFRRAEQQAAAIAFRSTVLRAWQEVDDALTAFAEAQSRRGDLAEAVRQDGIALTAARQRFAQGAADFLNVVSAQAALLRSQDQVAQSDTEIAGDLVRLYRALGGGWEISESGTGPT